jgi:hypothetical protein
VIATTTPQGWRNVNPSRCKACPCARIQRQAVAIELRALETRQAQQVAGAARLGARLRDRLAALARNRVRQLVDARVRNIAGAPEDRLALVAGRAALGSGATYGRRDRVLDVRGRGDRDGVDHVAAIGAAQLLLPRAIDPFARDVHAHGGSSVSYSVKFRSPTGAVVRPRRARLSR